jgi:membrane protease YdiL (CAAX protease family)
MPAPVVVAPAATPVPLVRPTIAAGVGAWVLYTLVVYGLQLRTGLPYTEWFATPDNAMRAGVVPLACGAALLLVLAVASRWHWLWRDPVRLPVTTLMRVAIVWWWVAIAVRVVGTSWAMVDMALLVPILAAGVLVGFAEETLFRGLFLRAMRADGRSEATAAVWTALAFGLFHLPNVFLGTGAVGLLQVALAALSGALLYVFRRAGGTIWPAMLAHGAWDASTFVAGAGATPWLRFFALPSLLVNAVLGIAILVQVARRDRRTIAIPAAD